MNLPDGFRISIDAKKVVDWKMNIRLLPEALQELERMAGPSPDERFLVDGDQINLKEETWAWYIEFDSGSEKRIGFWFKNRAHAVYFKTIWG